MNKLFLLFIVFLFFVINFNLVNSFSFSILENTISSENISKIILFNPSKIPIIFKINFNNSLLKINQSNGTILPSREKSIKITKLKHFDKKIPIYIESNKIEIKLDLFQKINYSFFENQLNTLLILSTVFGGIMLFLFFPKI